MTNPFNKLLDYFLLAELFQYVPGELRPFVQKSSSNYTIYDLLNLTQITEESPIKSSGNSIHLLTQWYCESNHRRKQELILVLHMNLINTAITKIHLIQNSRNCTIFDDILFDKMFPIDLFRKKIIFHFNDNLNNEQQQRLTINQALSYANSFIDHGYVIFLNLDIFFDQSLTLLQHRPLLNRQIILYLSRYEIDPSITTLGTQCSEESYGGSHDALIFQPPLNVDLIKKFPFEMGTWHLEMKIISEFLQANYTVRNPCKSIRTWHFHSSQVRHRLMPADRFFVGDDLQPLLRPPEWL